MASVTGRYGSGSDQRPHWQQADRYTNGDVNLADIGMLTYYSAELANRTAYECVGPHGGYGYMAESRIAQLFLDVRMFNLGGGTSQVMKEIVGKSTRW